ncbi:ubiquinol-cytochrome-c reductase complex assembly factor 1 [Sitophilus oryzae]|uniref:Ubiquinol-cytochrome-c reductase complex assembly factor 1 n=1 Tax=Sitophilus oryzae TaxID=7048 RepID=A0A6J2Y9C4_SITOR|nr:ubiquinol-cytochrome-c reductase complex assembly factor 1 [Sitophilus oryzae]
MNLTRSLCSLRHGGSRFCILKYSKQTAFLNTLTSISRDNLPVKNDIISQNTRFTSTCDVKSVPNEESAIQKFLKKIPFFKINTLRAKASGYLIYEAIVDKINYLEFFEKYDIPDTFYSWFVLTELHIWMVSVRAMADEVDGEAIRNGMIEALWSDVTQRIKRVGTPSVSGTRNTLMQLSEQLQAALLAYDEGVNSDDTVLAGAIWRRIYQKNTASPHHLEELVLYVRKHVNMLDGLSKEELLAVKPVVFEPV